MSELDLSLEHACASTDSPCNDWLGNCSVLDSLNDSVLLNPTNFSEQNQNFTFWVGLVSQEMVDKCCAWVSVTTNSNTLVYTIGCVCDNVVKLVGHTSGFGDVSDGTLSVKLGCNNVVHHSTSVTDLERSWLDTTNSGRTNNCDTLLLCCM